MLCLQVFMSMHRPFLEKLQDLEILNELGEIYYRSTGMIFSVHYPGKSDLFDFYPEDQRSKYCKIIQSTGREVIILGMILIYVMGQAQG